MKSFFQTRRVIQFTRPKHCLVPNQDGGRVQHHTILEIVTTINILFRGLGKFWRYEKTVVDGR